MKKILIITTMSVLFLSCKKSSINEESPSTLPASSLKSDLKKEFSKILVQALAASPSLRSLIKAEALKQFDKDYDVLYETIKYTKLDNGETVRSLLLNYSKDEPTFSQIEKELPLLTIFVPTLPNNSFSAEKWNTEIEIPEVGAEIAETNDVPMFKSDGQGYILKSDLIPGFPTVVVKECERVVQNDIAHSQKVNGSLLRINDKKFNFLDDCFNGNQDKISSRYTKTIDQKIIDAYDIYLNTTGWHRDYIYYGITPTNPTGQFSYDFKETITSFSMWGDAMSAFNKISDQTGEPKYNSVTFSPTASGWAGGNFEFKVSVLFNAKNGLGSVFETYFSALPSDLFNLTYSYNGRWYNFQSISLKIMPVDLQIFKWDLNQYAATIKIDVEEVDISETITESSTVSTKFATNFEIGPEGFLKKIGLKFGASLEQTNSSSFSRTYTLGSDKLGSVIVDFADKVIIFRGTAFGKPLIQTQEYTTGYYQLSLEPKRVQ